MTKSTKVSKDSRKPRVLVVHGNSFMSNLYKTKLSSAGYSVRTCKNGKKVQAAAELFTPDAILTDLLLPGESAIDYIPKLRSHKSTSTIPVLIISNAYNEEVFDEAIQSGADMFLDASSVTPSQVLDSLTNLIYGEPEMAQVEQIAYTDNPGEEEVSEAQAYEEVDITPETVVVKTKASKLKNTKPYYTWIAVAAVVAILIAGTILYNPASDMFVNSYNTVFGDEEISNIADRTGLNTHGKAMFYRNNPELVSADKLQEVCPKEKGVLEYGCYLPDKHKIYILRVSDDTYKEAEYATAAHETLHALWFSLGGNERANIVEQMKKIYLDNTNRIYGELHNKTQAYEQDECRLPYRLSLNTRKGLF